MLAHSHRNDFLESLVRCLESADFLAKFYERFVSSSELVAHKFRFTDFQKQQEMLAKSLRLIALASSGDQEGLQELAARAETHSQSGLDIEPELYDLWLGAVIKTAEEFDPQWDSNIQEAWQAILNYAIQYMTKRY